MSNTNTPAEMTTTETELSPADWMDAEFNSMPPVWTQEAIERSEKAAVEQAELSEKRTAELGLPARK